jgi:hypothetical protein
MVDELKFEEVNLNDIKPVEAKPTFDAKQYDGARVKIAEIKQLWQDSHYINGTYDPNMTEKHPFIEVTTEVVDTVGEGEKKIEVRAKARFSLQQDEKGNLIISKHPKGKLWKFMRKMGVDKLENLKGKMVTLTTEPSKDENDDRVWLRIVV